MINVKVFSKGKFEKLSTNDLLVLNKAIIDILLKRNSTAVLSNERENLKRIRELALKQNNGNKVKPKNNKGVRKASPVSKNAKAKK